MQVICYCPCMFFILKLKQIYYLVYSQVSRDSARFPVFTVGTLVENLLVCVMLSSSHRSTPHTIGAKRFNLGFFLSSCVVSHILKIL